MGTALSRAVDLAAALEPENTGALLEALKRAYRFGLRGRQACLGAWTMYAAFCGGKGSIRTAGEFARATGRLEELMREAMSKE